MFFTQFPKIRYDMDGNEDYKLVPDIFRRVKIRNKVRDNFSLYDSYDVENGEKPEDVAFKIYGSADYFYVILMMNRITNRYFEWPLSHLSFESYVKDKYEDDLYGVHHYERIQSSGKQKGDGPEDYTHLIECNETDTDAQSVSNYEYEIREQDKKRKIKILNPAYLSSFLEEFRKLIRR